jgi:ABC-type transport system involved in multi-copper enzyme maturation permease subunit
VILAARAMTGLDLPGLAKFYREVSLQAMNIATSLTIIYLAARQLPREFEWRTLHVLLAKPMDRFSFVAGKFLGVMLAGAFCYALFMAVFLIGHLATGGELTFLLFAQAVYLQLLGFAVLASLTLFLSMVLSSVQATVTIGALLYLTSQVFLNLMSFIYDYLGPVQQAILLVIHYLIPQLTLFDASAKVVHVWPALSWLPLAALTGYGLAYTTVFLAATYLLFRRRAL